MIAIIDYQAGNVASVRYALERLGVACTITADPATIAAAAGVIFPGQGRAGTALTNLRSAGIDRLIPQLTQPFLGICLGMQLLAEYSEEDATTCLGVLPGRCRKFPPTLNTPHLGWNQVGWRRPSPLGEQIPSQTYFYFVHSYYVDAPVDQAVGTASYGFVFPAVMQRGNFFATQFHPEKSGAQGLRLLQNFCALCL